MKYGGKSLIESVAPLAFSLILFFGKERIEISDRMDVVFWFSRLPDIRSLGFYLQTVRISWK